MGEYTPIYRFYKPDSNELVDVESHLNFNLNKADPIVASLLKYRPSDLTSLSTSFPELKGSGYKFLKTRSNSIWNFTPEQSTGPFQDTNSLVDSWSTSGIVFKNTYRNRDVALSKTRISYKLEGGISQTVHWRGQIERTNLDAWTLNSRVTVMDIPASATPAVTRHGFLTGGNSSSGFFMARVDVNPDSTLRLTPFGSQPGTLTNRFIDFEGFRYDLSADVV